MDHLNSKKKVSVTNDWLPTGDNRNDEAIGSFSFSNNKNSVNNYKCLFNTDTLIEKINLFGSYELFENGFREPKYFIYLEYQGDKYRLNLISNVSCFNKIFLFWRTE